MATAAFKSTSKREKLTRNSGSNPNSNSNPNNKGSYRQRSLSVPRIRSLEIPSEFLTKRDNPLFQGSSHTPPDKEIKHEIPDAKSLATSSLTSTTEQRGRLASRNLGVGSKKETGRSLSRVDNGRRHRSMSRGPYGISESEGEPESWKSSKFRNKNDSLELGYNAEQAKLVRNVPDTRPQVKSLRVCSSKHPAEYSDDSVSSLHIPYREDGISAGSSSEAEEKTIKAIGEQMTSFGGAHLESNTANEIYETVRSEVRRALSDLQHDFKSVIRSNNTTASATTNVADILPDLVNPGAIELVLDIRRGYARKLEESQERARKLQAELAVEEQHGQELDRILKEILPVPKTSSPQRSHIRRRKSIERKKMSKYLADEAMAYFDECVSISTFDSSDFSAAEDPPFGSVRATNKARALASLPQDNATVLISHDTNNFPNAEQQSDGNRQLMQSCDDICLTASSSNNKPTKFDQANQDREWGQMHRLSFDNKSPGYFGLREDIRSYVKHFEDNKDNNLEIKSSKYYNIDEYKIESQAERLLFDRVLFKDRIDSGTLHLCSGGNIISFSPFASVI